MIIRAARQQDAPQLAELVYAAAAPLLDVVFYSAKDSRDFLHSALQHADGQYGFANHWLALKNQQIVGAVTGWHHTLSQDFHQASLSSIVEYFGAEKSLQVLAKSMLLRQFIPPPLAHEWCIGHLAVSAPYQRQGVATYLLAWMAGQARLHGKTVLSLDVSQTNQGAIRFYQQQGFTLQHTSDLTDDMQRFGFTVHQHMCKSLV